MEEGAARSMLMAVSKPVRLRISILILTTVLMAGVFALDHQVGRQFDLWLLYMVPIGLVSMVLGPRYGYVMAILSTGLSLLDNFIIGTVYASAPALVFDRASNLLAYLLLVFLIGLARSSIGDNRRACDSQLPSAGE